MRKRFVVAKYGLRLFSVLVAFFSVGMIFLTWTVLSGHLCFLPMPDSVYYRRDNCDCLVCVCLH